MTFPRVSNVIVWNKKAILHGENKCFYVIVSIPLKQERREGETDCVEPDKTLFCSAVRKPVLISTILADSSQSANDQV